MLKFLGTAVLIAIASGELLKVALKQMPNNNNSEIISVTNLGGFAQPCSLLRDIFPERKLS
jgi:glycerol uptake facilitator-like aquaporin